MFGELKVHLLYMYSNSTKWWNDEIIVINNCQITSTEVDKVHVYVLLKVNEKQDYSSEGESLWSYKIEVHINVIVILRVNVNRSIYSCFPYV